MFIVSSKKLEMSPSSRGSARRTCGPGSSPAITKPPSSLNVNPPTSFPDRGIERDDVGAEHALAVLRDLAADAAGLALERLVAVDVRDAGDVVGLEDADR